MFTTLFNCSRIAGILGLAAGLLVAVNARAEDNSPVLRTFAYMPLDFSEPDFLSDDSLAIVVQPAPADPESAGTFELPLLLGEGDEQELTFWRNHPAKYVNKGGVKLDGDFFWLLDDDTSTTPPVGAHMFAGPNGWIETVEVVRIKLCASNSCGGNSRNNGKWAIDNVNGTRVFVIVTAWFSK